MLVSGARMLAGDRTNNNPQEINLPGLMLAKLASTQRVVNGLSRLRKKSWNALPCQ